MDEKANYFSKNKLEIEMKKSELEELSRLIASEVTRNSITSIGGTRLPTFDISTASSCCEGHCPCHSRNGGDCPCASRCACDGKSAYGVDDLMLFVRLSELEKQKIERVLEVAPILAKLRGIAPEM